MKEVVVVRVQTVDDHPERKDLTVNHLSNGAVCVSNLREDETARYRVGDLAIHVPPDFIVPEWLLQRQGCWNAEKGKGTLGGNKGNRSKPRRFGEIESDGMILACRAAGNSWFYDGPTGATLVEIGQDVGKTLGIERATGVKVSGV